MRLKCLNLKENISTIELHGIELFYNIDHCYNLIKAKGDKMCESNVYGIDGTKIMEDVINIKIDGEKIHLIDILNTELDIEGVIVEIDLEKHSILIEIK